LRRIRFAWQVQETEASRLINLVRGRETLGSNAGGFFADADATNDVRFWHKADIVHCGKGF
jgi:hypothetical protein